MAYDARILPLPVVTGLALPNGEREIVIVQIPQMTPDGYQFLLARLAEYKLWLEAGSDGREILAAERAESGGE